MTPCRQRGCTGTYADDGFCDECGHKAAPVPDGPDSRTRVAARGGLGANLVAVPPVPLRDPVTAVMADPQVPERSRFCRRCGEPVGRGRDGRPGPTDGFCLKDGTPFSFVPRLSPGELVHGRYQILGALAHGGFGWVYLARDRNVSETGADRWVVLKGLIDTSDPAAMASAISERRFLVEVDHPNIVKIHDFVQHPDPKTRRPTGYTVMEYVGGRSLRELAAGPDGRWTPLPLPQVMAYGLEVLPALGYLHTRGLLFCDFKPDNVIQAEEQLKLIDLGGVRRIGDDHSVLFGTRGYEAPEVATAGPSIGSDLFTVGRTMAVLSFDFVGFSTRFASRLPDPIDVELFTREESYYRFLRRATHPDVNRRFRSAGEMAEQLLGVLREVLAAGDGKPRAGTSTQFTPERQVFGATDETLDGDQVAAGLPIPLADTSDAAAGFLAALGTATIDALRAAPAQTLEVRLQMVRAYVADGDTDAAAAELLSLPDDGSDWRFIWHAGLISLVAGFPDQARAQFAAVYDAVPGEPGAQLALAAACELAGDVSGATRRYERVWRVDHGFLSAAFGLSRMRLAVGDRAGAVAVLDEVPETSSQQIPAQIAAVRGRFDFRPGSLTEGDLIEASTRLQRLRLDSRRQATLAVEMFHTALRWLGRDAPPPAAAAAAAAAGRMLGHELTERELRFGLERSYRVLANLEDDRRLRRALVDQANEVRPWTLI
jgi:serine/threonine-protein kinase PknG